MWSVIGHDRALASLKKSLAERGPSHAYLVTGPAQAGKTRLALDLARVLNCTDSEPPCDICRSCKEIEAGRHPDVEIVSVGGLCDENEHDHQRDNSKDIKICQIRRLKRLTSLQPFQGRTRVIIVEPAEALNVHAADALLKTLEEPPDHVVLILVAASEESLLETIRSRCRQIALAAVPTAAIQRELLRRGVEPDQAGLLARLSGGRIGWALASSKDPGVLTERSARLTRLEMLGAAGRAERLAFTSELASRFSRTRQDIYALLSLWESWWRDVLLIHEGCEKLVAHEDRLPALRAAVENVGAPAVVKALRALRDCRQHLDENVNPRLALDVLVLRMPNTAGTENKEVEGRRVAPHR